MGKKATHYNRGFTILEITIAILILASSLVTLLGLQSAAIQRTIRDNSEQQAMLIARTILAAVEAQEDPSSIRDASGTAFEVMRGLMQPPKDDLPEDSPYNTYLVEMQVQSADVPGMAEGVLRRIDLRVSWGETNAEAFDIIYFIPSAELGESGDDDEDEDEEDGGEGEEGEGADEE